MGFGSAFSLWRATRWLRRGVRRAGRMAGPALLTAVVGAVVSEMAKKNSKRDLMDEQSELSKKQGAFIERARLKREQKACGYEVIKEEPFTQRQEMSNETLDERVLD